MRFKVEILDTWNMTITPVESEFVTRKKDNYHFIDENAQAVRLPGKPYMALRIYRVPKPDDLSSKAVPPPADGPPE
jgi:hypothetical protein